jgi:formylglycine-generating enzyme required for sulfatase activity
MVYLIVIGIVIYLIYLLIVKVIVPLIIILAKVTAIIAVAALAISAAIGFIVSIVNYIKSFVSSIDPYTTYIDKNPKKPENAKRNYFFGPGQHQIRMIVKGAWANNARAIKILWGKVKILAIVPILIIAVMGSVWTVVFSVAHSLVLFPFIIIFRILFGVLAIIDRLVLAFNSISARCPDCKKRSTLPDFVCPSCGAVSKRLVPGHYGIFYRRCSCGKRLPSTFLNGRSRLEARCPHCGHDLATSNARNFGIQLVGGVRSGKTTFLASFIHKYLEAVKKNPRIDIKLFPTAEFDEMERWYSQGFTESTSAMNANMYSIIHTWKRSQFSHQLSVYDIAGEVFSNESASAQEQYRYCEGLIIVVDPFSSRSVRAIYEGEHNGQSPANYSTSDMQEVVTGFINEFSKIGILSVGKMSDVPVSVIISKADADMVKQEIGYDRIDSVCQGNPQAYKTRDGARDAVCRDYLFNIGMAGMVNNLAAQFSKIHYFPVSAMGHEKGKPEAYDPWGILEPVMWIIKEKDQGLLDILDWKKKRMKDLVKGIAVAAAIFLVLMGSINFYSAHKEYLASQAMAYKEYFVAQVAAHKEFVYGKVAAIKVFVSDRIAKIIDDQKRAAERKIIKAVEEKTDSSFIEGGTFTMGSPASEEGRDRDELEHEVALSSFFMGRHEVTQRDYQKIMGTNPSRNQDPNLPVDQVSWYDAVAFCNARSRAEGLSQVYIINGKDVGWNKYADGYRLPTEAEWEYACRAGTATAYSYGDSISLEQAKYENGSLPDYAGSYEPNGKGLYDMHGNLWEWCWDRYGAYPEEAQADPSGPSSGASRVNRGGGWGSKAPLLRSASRDSDFPDHKSAFLGFRVARTYHPFVSDASQPSAQPSALVIIDFANIRSGPDLSINNVIVQARKDDILTITGTIEKGWLPVEYEGHAGFISADLVKVDEYPAPQIQEEK